MLNNTRGGTNSRPSVRSAIATRALAFVGACYLTGCVANAPPPRPATDLHMPSGQAVQLLREGKIRLIDTRAPSERSARSISGSVSIQYGSDPWQEDVSENDKRTFVANLIAAGMTVDDAIVTVCNAGVRAMAAAEFLRSTGFTKARSISGGYIGSNSDPGWQFSQ